MESLIKNWQQLNQINPDKLAATSNTIHHAAQFLALAGKYFVPEKSDDSHTAAFWLPEKEWLISQTINTPEKRIMLALDYQEFTLLIVDENLTSFHRKEIEGLTKHEIMLWLSLCLHDVGVDSSLLVDKLHYQIPDHPVNDGGIFNIEHPDSLALLTGFRNNGHLILTHFAEKFSSAHPVMVWPHHFDEGCYVPLQTENNEATTSISFGLAVPDANYNNPYFYVTAWRRNGIDYNDLPTLSPPGKWHTHGWTGQVLEGKDLFEMGREEQIETTMKFMQVAVENARRMTGWVYK